MSGAKFLLDKEAFQAYKKDLDKNSWRARFPDGYKHRHNNEPDDYPCMVISHYWDDPNGPFTYDHYFVYLHDIGDMVPLYINKEFEYELLEE